MVILSKNLDWYFANTTLPGSSFIEKLFATITVIDDYHSIKPREMNASHFFPKFP